MKIEYSLKNDKGYLDSGKENIELNEVEKANLLILIKNIIERSLIETNMKNESMERKNAKNNGVKNG